MRFYTIITGGVLAAAALALAVDSVRVPQIDGAFWQVAGDPNLGKYTTPKQEPVDFAIWQAGDGTWQLWSCIRGTAYPGKTRLFYRWQGDKITSPDWKPMGIAMMADPAFGETEGGLQAPHVIKTGGVYKMLYGDWNNICLAESTDGKTFVRQLMPNGKAGMFNEGFGEAAQNGNGTRDPMVLKIANLFYCYYTAGPHGLGADYVRTSKDLRNWSSSRKVAFGGSAGTGGSSAECPFVYYHEASGYYYLFRTQHYGQTAQMSVYGSKDPTDFGVGDDRYLVSVMPYVAPELVEDRGQLYIAVLLPSLKGIQIAKLKWAPKQ